MVNRALLLKLRNLLDEIRQESDFVEVMWQIRTHECGSQAEIPQAIFKVGDQLASLIYLEDICCWEVQLDGVETKFCSITGFDEALEFIESARVVTLGVG